MCRDLNRALVGARIAREADDTVYLTHRIAASRCSAAPTGLAMCRDLNTALVGARLAREADATVYLTPNRSLALLGSSYRICDES